MPGTESVPRDDGTSELAELRRRAEQRAADEGVAATADPDVTRRLELLWGDSRPAGRGRKPRFTLPEVTAAGVQLADRDGLEALSMRRVAQELGVGAMSLYTYVPGRSELVDLMVDRVYAELELPGGDQRWRAEVRQYARAYFDLYHRHPWLLQVNLWRAPLAPHVLDAQEAGLRALQRTGLDAPTVVRTLGLVDTFVQGTARASLAEDRDRQDSGLDMDAHWQSVSSFWTDYFDYARYPTMARLYADGGFAVSDDFEAALDRLLTIVELSLAAAGPAR